MESKSENTKRIAINTLLLYVRMLFGMLVSLYTSRVVLQALGVEDYGIYNVVGGVVGMLGFLNASMSGATSRFLTYSMGKGDLKEIQETFSSALIIHIGIALFVLIIAETIGLWFLINKLNIPTERLEAAHVVYQISIFSALIGITQVPYNSCIIAHEKMSIYAYVEILNVILKLLIVFVLFYIDTDKLIVYGILMFVVSTIIMFLYRGYCLKNYQETHFTFVWSPSKLKPMLNFSGWDLYGNASVMLRLQGVSVILNMFIGPVANAANGIASSVNSVMMSFIGNILTAFRPQIIKSYANRDLENMFSLMIWAVKICLTLFLLLTIPLIAEMPFVLNLWLHDVPMYTVEFCRLMLITSCFTTVTSILNIGIHASGKMFLISFLSGTIIWMAVPVIYFLLKWGYSPSCAYICNGIVSVLVMFINLFILKYNINEFPIVRFMVNGVSRALFIGIILILSIYYIHINFVYGWNRFFLILGISFVEGVVLSCFLVLNVKNRLYIKEKLKQWI